MGGESTDALAAAPPISWEPMGIVTGQTNRIYWPNGPRRFLLDSTSAANAFSFAVFLMSLFGLVD